MEAGGPVGVFVESGLGLRRGRRKTEGVDMFAELLTVERSEVFRDLLASYPFKPYAEGALFSGKTRKETKNGKEPAKTWEESLLSLLVASIGRAVESGGIARVYCADKKVVGLCVTELDDWASRVLGRRAARVSHLMALGRPEVQTIIKQLILSQTLRETPRGTVLVARVPYVDLSSINALERCGFTATQTSIVMARELEESLPDSTPLGHYEIAAAGPDDVDEFDDAEFDINGGFLGWDAGLPCTVAARVHRDWLRVYARERRLLMARDHGEPVGLLAECLKTETEPPLGFRVGSIDLVKTANSYRENGVATDLISRGLAAFRGEGARLAELTVDSMDVPLIRSCQSLGFMTVGSSLTLVNRRT